MCCDAKKSLELWQPGLFGVRPVRGRHLHDLERLHRVMGSNGHLCLATTIETQGYKRQRKRACWRRGLPSCAKCPLAHSTATRGPAKRFSRDDMRSGSNLGSWMCFQASSAGPSAYCFAFSRKEGMSSKHCRAGPSRCSPARSGRVGLPLPRWLLPEVNSRSYAPRLRRVGVLRIEVGTRWPFYLDLLPAISKGRSPSSVACCGPQLAVRPLWQ